MRLSFTWLAAAGLAAALSVPAAAQDYPSVNIRFGHSIPSTTTSGLADGWVAQEVAKRSNGKVKINMFWAGAAGSPAELFSLLSGGALDAAAITPSWYAANLPFLSPLSSMPFAYPNVASAQKVAKTLYAEMPALQKEAKANKLHVLRFALINNYHMMCTTPVRAIADFKGRKVRSQGDLLPLVLNALGATPVTVLPGEFYEALQRGTVDCIVLPWDFLASNRLYEVAKFATTINFGPIVAHASMMNLDKWNSLPPQVQKLIADVEKEAEAYDLKVVRNRTRSRSPPSRRTVSRWSTSRPGQAGGADPGSVHRGLSACPNATASGRRRSSSAGRNCADTRFRAAALPPHAPVALGSTKGVSPQRSEATGREVVR
jgi:TRAP-type C4-dicarboxylate transport system substrate-binding protein